MQFRGVQRGYTTLGGTPSRTRPHQQYLITPNTAYSISRAGLANPVNGTNGCAQVFSLALPTITSKFNASYLHTVLFTLLWNTFIVSAMALYEVQNSNHEID